MEKRISVKLPESTHKKLKKECEENASKSLYPYNITQLLNLIVQEYFTRKDKME